MDAKAARLTTAENRRAFVFIDLREVRRIGAELKSKVTVKKQEGALTFFATETCRRDAGAPAPLYPFIGRIHSDSVGFSRIHSDNCKPFSGSIFSVSGLEFRVSCYLRFLVFIAPFGENRRKPEVMVLFLDFCFTGVH
jgi:hypothetical protein